MISVKEAGRIVQTKVPKYGSEFISKYDGKLIFRLFDPEKPKEIVTDNLVAVTDSGELEKFSEFENPGFVDEIIRTKRKPLWGDIYELA